MSSESAKASPPSLVQLNPPDVLTFKLHRNTAPKAILRVTNKSNAKVAFKIKTTQPNWYYVRPNQQIIDVNKTEEVTIVLVDVECNKFLDQLNDDQSDKQLEKHRFLVQSRIIDDATYERISALPHNARSDEYTKIWDNNKDDRKNQKLRVEFILPEAGENGDGTSNIPSTTSVNSINEAMEKARKKLPKMDSSQNSVKLSENSSTETILSELQNTKKKYDALVEYTVHLTAERDFHFSQLEELKRELSKEKAKKKAVETIKGGKTTEKTVDKKGDQQGFSLFLVVFLALLAFFLGKYFRT